MVTSSRGLTSQTKSSVKEHCEVEGEEGRRAHPIEANPPKKIDKVFCHVQKNTIWTDLAEVPEVWSFQRPTKSEEVYISEFVIAAEVADILYKRFIVRKSRRTFFNNRALEREAGVLQKWVDTSSDACFLR